MNGFLSGASCKPEHKFIYDFDWRHLRSLASCDEKEYLTACSITTTCLTTAPPDSHHTRCAWCPTGLPSHTPSNFCFHNMSSACPAISHVCTGCHRVKQTYRNPSLSTRRSVRRSSDVYRSWCRGSCAVKSSNQSRDDASDDLSSAFAREMASRTDAQEKALEQGEAATFGGRQLLDALQSR